MTDDAELQAKIAAVAGQINRHKTQQTPLTSGQHPRQEFPHHSQRGSRWTPYNGNRRVPYKNKTLVVGANETTPSSTGASTPAAESDSHPLKAAKTGFVKSLGTNNQLMTKATYDREQSVKQDHKMQPRPASKHTTHQTQSSQELQKLVQHFRSPAVSRELNIEGVQFVVKDDGSKLVRVSDSANNKETPKKAVIAGVDFLRTKNGNLLRRSGLNDSSRTSEQRQPQCEHFTKNGKCPYGPSCRFAHDPEKVAMCKTWLRSGTCPAGDYCDLSHKPTYNRVPACTHFFQGACTNDPCRYPHIRVSPGAPVCRAFATLGYCAKGTKCEERHVVECPDYANTGKCANIGKCLLPHVLRASTGRAAARTSSEDDSEVEESGNEKDTPTDVGSDDLAEDIVMSGSDELGQELSKNDDFISFA